ncbi:hypothetical protein EVAR_623_1 [Eumeta japonica]|uniref:Pre-C2HC domain-containing protein n=1 Tax=Eumeta variegata TaxID=151549 RepID=A0A4C1SE27_EUMVA|nr:hypothetical protein EVAR_623_1 [Eumeta japonica]
MEPIPRTSVNFEDSPASSNTPQARETTATPPYNAVSSACDRLKIQYASARNLVDSIKITVPRITDFRGLNNYLINNNIVFYTHPLVEECKVKAVIRGIPVEFTTNEVMTDLANRGYAVHSVHILHRKDGTLGGLMLAVFNKANKTKDIFKKILESIRPLRHHCRGNP